MVKPVRWCAVGYVRWCRAHTSHHQQTLTGEKAGRVIPLKLKHKHENYMQYEVLCSPRSSAHSVYTRFQTRGFSVLKKKKEKAVRTIGKHVGSLLHKSVFAIVVLVFSYSGSSMRRPSSLVVAAFIHLKGLRGVVDVVRSHCITAPITS